MGKARNKMWGQDGEGKTAWVKASFCSRKALVKARSGQAPIESTFAQQLRLQKELRMRDEWAKICPDCSVFIRKEQAYARAQFQKLRRFVDTCLKRPILIWKLGWGRNRRRLRVPARLRRANGHGNGPNGHGNGPVPSEQPHGNGPGIKQEPRNTPANPDIRRDLGSERIGHPDIRFALCSAAMSGLKVCDCEHVTCNALGSLRCMAPDMRAPPYFGDGDGGRLPTPAWEQWLWR